MSSTVFSLSPQNLLIECVHLWGMHNFTSWNQIGHDYPHFLFYSALHMVFTFYH